jgi:hypothetical protein
MKKLIATLTLAVLPVSGSAATYHMQATFMYWDEPIHTAGEIRIDPRAFQDQGETRVAAFTWDGWHIITATADHSLISITGNLMLGNASSCQCGSAFWLETDRWFNPLNWWSTVLSGPPDWHMNPEKTVLDAGQMFIGPAPRFEQISPIPLPPAAGLLLGGVAALSLLRRRSKAQARPA